MGGDSLLEVLRQCGQSILGYGGGVVFNGGSGRQGSVKEVWILH